MNIKEALVLIVSNIDLEREQMRAVMRQVMTGEATQAQIGALLASLRMKSESIDEITGAVEVMRELMTPVEVQNVPYLVDIVGTGGDEAGIFNVSSASAFVAAAAGCHVAKHGGRSVSSKSGSADLLEAAGIQINLNPEQIARSIEEVGVGFMFAPNHHSAMRHAAGPRNELGLRTLFNILGPLTNPARVKRQVVGVFSERLCRPLAEVLSRLGAEHIMVVHGLDGLDEISLASRTKVVEYKEGALSEYYVTPEEMGVDSASLVGLDVKDPQESLALIRDVFGQREMRYAEKAANMIALNAGAAIYVSGVAETLVEGVRQAGEIIRNGKANERLEQVAAFTQAIYKG
ncbi:MAG TPA: anthranilate phosphoribosyltransferase [Alcanivoracaceae bacterium]|nr:anthranilate phosphoribosyltransferase [Alcanivoracaceae bacterium]